MKKHTPEMAQAPGSHHEGAVNLHQLSADLQEWYKIHQLRFEELFLPPLPGESRADLEEISHDLDTQRYERAISKCDRTISLAPEHPVAYGLRGIAFHRLGQYGPAINDYSAAIELICKSLETFRLANSCTTDHLLRSDEYLSMYHSNRALSLHASGDHESAIDDEREAIRLDPNYSQSHIQHGISLMESGDFVSAVAFFERALALDPFDSDAHFNLGWCHECLGECAEAIDSYTHVIQLKPDEQVCRIHRSYVYCNQGQFDSALADVTKAVEIDPESCDAYFARAQVYLYMKEYNLSLADYQMCISLRQGNSADYCGCGNCRLGLRDYEGALNDYHVAMSLSEGQPDPDLLNNLAWTLATCPDDRLRDGAEAVRLATAACTQSNWKVSHQLGTLGAAYAEIGDFTQAIYWHEQAIALEDPDKKESLQLELSSYKQGKPWRDPHV